VSSGWLLETTSSPFASSFAGASHRTAPSIRPSCGSCLGGPCPYWRSWRGRAARLVVANLFLIHPVAHLLLCSSLPYSASLFRANSPSPLHALPHHHPRPGALGSVQEGRTLLSAARYCSFLLAPCLLLAPAHARTPCSCPPQQGSRFQAPASTGPERHAGGRGEGSHGRGAPCAPRLPGAQLSAAQVLDRHGGRLGGNTGQTVTVQYKTFTVAVHGRRSQCCIVLDRHSVRTGRGKPNPPK
jgi:hypothetical protein